MRTPSSDLVLNALYERIDRLDDGARLPTVRELMRSFRVSQAAVQEAFARLRDEGLVNSRVGRGTYVVKGEAAAARRGGAIVDARLDSLLILSNQSMNERCSLVQNHIVGETAEAGSKVVQISYHNTDHLLDLLGSVPRFDAAILQSHYESIPVRLLNLLQGKARALVVDGHSVSGVDIDRVGTDWEEALDLALEHLGALGHRRVGLVSLDSTAQPILSVRRAFGRLGSRGGGAFDACETVLLRGVLHPTQGVADALGDALAGLGARSGTLPFTAVVCLGISDAMGVRLALDRLGLSSPADLSVYILGHHDVPTEHFGHFTMAGSSHREAASELMASIRRRLAEPGMPPRIAFLATREVVRASTASPRG